MTSHVTTHVLDAVTGIPAAGIAVRLSRIEGDGASGAAGAETATEVAAGTTNSDGRIRDLGPEVIDPGTYRITFATGEYFRAQGVETFYPSVTIDFFVDEGRDHYHVPCLLSPFAYSTYRGS
ncbi:hydroxyisourate hydrolase [Georgenia sp. Z1344]|uniref:hydroxyisourate hydrolase n=1 Tax=Georgenia sp. Z1344 TaxID=3416706 RepID=UPI003CEEA415